MIYLDSELNIPWAFFCENYSKWTNLDNPIVDPLLSAINGVCGPAGPHRNPHWQWANDNKQELINLYNLIK